MSEVTRIDAHPHLADLTQTRSCTWSRVKRGLHPTAQRAAKAQRTTIALGKEGRAPPENCENVENKKL